MLPESSWLSQCKCLMLQEELWQWSALILLLRCNHQAYQSWLQQSGWCQPKWQCPTHSCCSCFSVSNFSVEGFFCSCLPAILVCIVCGATFVNYACKSLLTSWSKEEVQTCALLSALSTARRAQRCMMGWTAARKLLNQRAKELLQDRFASWTKDFKLTCMVGCSLA